jgi:hypothetical protein
MFCVAWKIDIYIFELWAWPWPWVVDLIVVLCTSFYNGDHFCQAISKTLQCMEYYEADKKSRLLNFYLTFKFDLDLKDSNPIYFCSMHCLIIVITWTKFFNFLSGLKVMEWTQKCYRWIDARLTDVGSSL